MVNLHLVSATKTLLHWSLWWTCQKCSLMPSFCWWYVMAGPSFTPLGHARFAVFHHGFGFGIFCVKCFWWMHKSAVKRVAGYGKLQWQWGWSSDRCVLWRQCFLRPCKKLEVLWSSYLYARLSLCLSVCTYVCGQHGTLNPADWHGL